MKTSYIRIRLNDYEKKELEEKAKANNMTMSDYIRFCINYFEKNQKNG